LTQTLLIFIRNPQLGKVKTRLARTVGDAEALRIYRILLEKTRAAASGVRAERWLFYSDFVDDNDEWPAAEFIKKTQANGDLGERMEQAFQTAFEAGAKKVVIIGSDCPALTGDLLQQAFDALDHADFVLGPVPDGGYYLLGMKHLEPTVFRGIAWSTETVRAHTFEKIKAAGKSCFLLPLLSDVDTEEDWLGQ
jgi:rSAM/selenodomain-associated transferase 1